MDEVLAHHEHLMPFVILAILAAGNIIYRLGKRLIDYLRR